MAILTKIDSNSTGLRFQEETSIGVANVANSWFVLEPNSYGDFGGEITVLPRNPINDGRQRKKGPTVDLDASGTFNMDLTQTNFEDIAQGYFFSDLRPKGEEVPTGATATTDLFDVASTTGIFVGSLIFVSGFVNSANNGLHLVSAIVADTTVAVITSSLVTETPPAGANLVVVGFEFGTDELIAVGTGALGSYTAATKDLTQLGLLDGEFIFVGGDLAADQFPTNADNNGYKRVQEITTNSMKVTKSNKILIDETTAGGEKIRIFFGRVLKNELAANIKRRTYQLERTLGDPEAPSTGTQAEYLVGSLTSEWVMNVSTADKINMDLSFVSIDNETIDAPTSLKAGARPAIVEADAFNTSSDFSRIRLAKVSTTTEAETDFFAFVQEFTIGINNNVSPNKAIGVLGAFEVTSGTFEVGGSMTAYFQNVSTIKSIRDNDDLTFDFIIAKANAGISFDIPLLTLGDGRPNVEQDTEITIPLSTAAATGAKVDPLLDHTLMMSFYDFLPNAALV